MAADIDAVIAALQVALEEAQKTDASHCKVEAANRWITLLPGAWAGRWRNLVLAADSEGEAPRDEFVGHVRAVLAFLDANRASIGARRKWWPAYRRGASNQAGGQAARVPASTPAARPVNLLRVRKPMPGVH